MVKSKTVEFVNQNRSELEMIAENGSKSAQRIAEALLASVPENE